MHTFTFTRKLCLYQDGLYLYEHGGTSQVQSVHSTKVYYAPTPLQMAV